MNYKTCILLICTVSVAHCQNDAPSPLANLFSSFTSGGGLGNLGGNAPVPSSLGTGATSTGTGASSSGAGGVFNQLLGQLFNGNAGSLLASSAENTQREKDFNALLDQSYTTCSAKGYPKTDTARTCPDTPTITLLLRQKIPGDVRTLQRQVQKDTDAFGPFNDTLKHCESRLNDNTVSWADLNTFMTAKGNTSWQATAASKTEWQATVTNCGKLIAEERTECNHATSILCAFAQGEHFACRTPASLKLPTNANVNRAACDKIEQKLRADALYANNGGFW